MDFETQFSGCALTSPKDALAYVRENPIDIAFLDIAIPECSGLALAGELRKLRSDVLIVFVSAYDDFLRESNQLGADYYIVKPYTEEVLELMMERIRLLAKRQEKNIYIQTFGRFLVLKNGVPLPLSGKAKEILALIVTRRGREISNDEIYSTLWETRPCGSESMPVYYNALRRLKRTLDAANLSHLLISTTRGQLVNTELFDCDYYAWQDKKGDLRDRFLGEFLPEYSWGEYILAELLEWK